jgi:Rrf2 family transcriptional regulator, iron-sulfur cluster assembly transcription factor
MLLSKSFGYALRGVLYVALMNDENRKTPVDEIARRLSVPRHFLGKIMKAVVKAGVLNSRRGQQGGFFINEKTLQTTLMKLVEITGETTEPGGCVLSLRKCNVKKPCPMHNETEILRKQWNSLLLSTTLGDLVNKSEHDFIQSIATTG